MKKVPYLLAAAAISGLALSATPSSANPLANGLASGNVAIPQASDGLVQKVHSWHCRKRFSRRLGWHRHRRACYDDDYSYGYGYPGIGFGAPFFAFQFFDDDDGRRHHRRKFRRKRSHKNNY
jgi:hypothetical protein